MSYGLNLGWGAPIGEHIGFWGEDLLRDILQIKSRAHMLAPGFHEKRGRLLESEAFGPAKSSPGFLGAVCTPSIVLIFTPPLPRSILSPKLATLNLEYYSSLHVFPKP